MYYFYKKPLYFLGKYKPCFLTKTLKERTSYTSPEALVKSFFIKKNGIPIDFKYGRGRRSAVPYSFTRFLPSTTNNGTKEAMATTSQSVAWSGAVFRISLRKGM